MTKADVARPRFHFTPRTGWINDPHGITLRDGHYEVFYQYVPGQTEWAPSCHWGHASGEDLLTLAERGIAIAPGDGDDGIWTGCLVADGPTPRVFYTAVSTPDFGIGRVRWAEPIDDQWDTWRKGDVVVQAPPGFDLIAFRDPFIRREGDLWRMFVGAASRDGRAMALSYSSHDLSAWHFDGVALERNKTDLDPVWTGALWECPQVFVVGGVSVMVSSIWDADELHYAAYAVGSYESARFSPTGWGRLTWGPSLYAPSLFLDKEGLPALTFWMRGVGGTGWMGAHSLPYRVGIEDGRLVAAPHPDVAKHRTEMSATGQVPGLTADIEWESEGGALFVYSGGDAAIEMRRAGDTLAVTASGTTERIPCGGAIRILVDGPTLEISSSEGIYARAFEPSGADLRVLADDGQLRVYGLE